MNFASFLSSHAMTMGDKDAVVCEGKRLSFKELDTQTTQLAQALRDKLGVMPGDRVAVYLPNGIEFVVCFVAAIKAGALAVPINLPLSAPEITHILDDCQPKVAFINAVTQEVYARAVEGVAAPATIATDAASRADWRSTDLMAASVNAAPLNIPGTADDCMVGYTSGTTGRPKGVILTQSNFMFVNGYLNGWYWRLTSEDRHLTTTPLAHRTAMARMMNMILHGATLVIMVRFNAQEAWRLVKQEKITVFGMVPTVGRLMLPLIEAHPQDFAHIKVVTVTGEAFPMEAKKRMQHAMPQARFYSFYAMTEAGAISWLDSSELLTHSASVGRPWPGVEVKLVGGDGQQAAVDEVGEVWVRSGTPGFYSTMRGYFNRPKETEEAIRDGWVVTGDMGRFDADGYLYLVDRKKDMVLSGGYNIYCKEVEMTIQSFPGVADVAVVGVPDPVYGEAVAAYVQMAEGVQADEQAIIAHCKAQIASYKKPKFVRFVSDLPRNSTGKVLKVELRKQFDPAEFEKAAQ